MKVEVDIRVKKLKWIGTTYDIKSQTVIGTYYITRLGVGASAVYIDWAQIGIRTYINDLPVRSEEECKIMAQEHYDAEVIKLLDFSLASP